MPEDEESAPASYEIYCEGCGEYGDGCSCPVPLTVISRNGTWQANPTGPFHDLQIPNMAELHRALAAYQRDPDRTLDIGYHLLRLEVRRRELASGVAPETWYHE